MPKRGSWYEANENAVRGVVTPYPTATWCPIAHDYILDRVQESIYAAGFAISDKRFFLQNEKQQFLGMLHLEMGVKTMVVGIMNSHDKTMAATILAGQSVSSRLYKVSFFHEVRVARKHTKFIERDFPGKVGLATTMVLNKLDEIGKRMEAYGAEDFSNPDKRHREYMEVHDILVQLMEAKAFPASALPKVLEAVRWRGPRGHYNGVHIFQEVVSFINTNGGNPFTLAERTQAVYGVLDKITGFQIKESEDALAVMSL